MELIFLGRGAGFFPVEGSTSAYFIENGEMFLIDSGESIFKTILDRKILDSVSKLNIFITHTHADHVGSLGTLILYAFAIKKMTVNIIFDENMKFLSSLKSLLVIFGLNDDMYNLVNASEYNGKYSSFDKVYYIETKHCDELVTCSIKFETKQGLVFYSGDISELDPISDILKSGVKVDKMYVDTNNNRNKIAHHISIHQLNEIIPDELKSKIYCMHINNLQCIDEAKAYGFKVVEKI